MPGGSLNENDSHGLVFEYLLPSWWDYLGRIQGSVGLLEEV